MALRGRKRGLLLLVFILLVFAAACQERQAAQPTPAAVGEGDAEGPPAGTLATATATAQPQPTATATAEPTATAAPTATPVPDPKELVVCMAAEPADLYLYGTDMLVQRAVFHAIYENLYTNLGYGYQPQGLEKLPSLEDEDAAIEAVLVTAGDRVVDAAGNVVLLGRGTPIVSPEGQVVEFQDEPLLMNQMRADFTFQPLVWEDGEPVTAEDSVFSYQVAAAPQTRWPDARLEYTASYEAAGERTVRWRGLPGWIDQEYYLNVWQPLPEHVLGQLTPAEMREAAETLRTPLANGPFRLEDWTPGEELTLVRNEHYYRAAEGLPHLDQVTFRFTYSPEVIASGLLDGTCHIGYQDGVDLGGLDELLAAGAEGTIVPHVVAANVYEHLDFGINPAEGYAATRPDWFEDVRVRQAMAQCVDRPALLGTVYQGQGELLHAYVPEEHPLYPADGLVWGYDPAAGNALLDAVGLLDRNGDGVREDIDSTRPFTVTLMTTAGSELRTTVAEQVAADLAGCGIQASVQPVDPQLFFAAGPEGPLFGRQYDLAVFAWLIHTIPACETYDSLEIPGPLPDYPAGWVGNNVSGWQNEAYDAACERALASLPGTADYAEAHQEALRIFMEQLPSLPLLPRLKASLVRPEVLNFHLDASEPSELWNLFELDLVTEDGE